MTKTSQLARLAAAVAALVIAGTASAQDSSVGTFTPEIGVTSLHGRNVERSSSDTTGSDSIGINLAFGWEHPSGLGVRAVFLADANPVRGLWELQSGVKSFDRFVGVEGTGSLALGSAVNLKGGLGIGQSHLNVSPNTGDSDVTDGLLSLGVQWRMAHHYAMELRVDYLTKTRVSSAGLQFQVPF